MLSDICSSYFAIQNLNNSDHRFNITYFVDFISMLIELIEMCWFFLIKNLTLLILQPKIEPLIEKTNAGTLNIYSIINCSTYKLY